MVCAKNSNHRLQSTIISYYDPLIRTHDPTLNRASKPVSEQKPLRMRTRDPPPNSHRIDIHIDNREWAGAVQFGTFNRLRICPVLQVSCPWLL